METEAKLCSCGGKPVYLVVRGAGGYVFHRMACLKCGNAIHGANKEKAIERWNWMVNAK